MNIDMPTPITSFGWLFQGSWKYPLKNSRFSLRILKKITMERIEKYYEEIGKIIKDLTFSYVDKQGELWDDKKKIGRKFDY